MDPTVNQNAPSRPVDYWAAKPIPECVEACISRIDAYYKWVRTYGRLALWRKALSEYYAGAYQGGDTGVAGEQEEFTTVKVNHLHSFGEAIVTAVAGQPPQFEPQASNSDHESTAQTVIARGILEDALTQKNLDDVAIEATRFAQVLGEGYGTVLWDPTKGAAVAANPATGEQAFAGEVVYRSHPAVDVVRDYLRDTDKDHSWYIVRTWRCRFDVLAEHPELRDGIMAAPVKLTEDLQRPRLATPRLLSDYWTDEIPVWMFVHEKTPALPQGRQFFFTGANAVWGDGPLTYRRMPVYRLAPETQMGTERGNTSTFDLLPLQQVINATYSVILSNHNAFGSQSVWVPENSNLSVEEIGKGLSIIKGGLQPPQPLNLVSTPPEIPNFAQNMISQMEILSGVNAVRRGNIEASGRLSGAAYALIDSKFLESLAGLQKSYRRWMSSMASATIECFQDFAKTEHTVRIVGKSNRTYAASFTADKIKRISRVDIEMGNPLQRTTSGRLQLAQMLMEMGTVKTPEQLIQVVNTGRIEPATEGAAKELDNVRAENEIIGDGKFPVAVAIDNHPLHIDEHAGVLSSPEARENPALVQGALAHIQEHINLWVSTDPQILAARKIPPPPAAMMAAAGGPPGGPPPMGGPAAKPPPALDQMGEAQLPRMPINPGTGERAPDAPA
jgi:hypothetical protein